MDEKPIPTIESIFALAEWLDAKADSDLVKRYVETLALREGLRQAIAAEGFTVTNQRGGTSTHPCVRELRAVDVLLLNMADRLLLTPKARQRAGMEVAADDALADWLP